MIAPIAPRTRSSHMNQNRRWPGVPNRYSTRSSSRRDPAEVHRHRRGPSSSGVASRPSSPADALVTSASVRSGMISDTAPTNVVLPAPNPPEMTIFVDALARDPQSARKPRRVLPISSRRSSTRRPLAQGGAHPQMTLTTPDHRSAPAPRRAATIDGRRSRRPTGCSRTSRRIWPARRFPATVAAASDTTASTGASSGRSDARVGAPCRQRVRAVPGSAGRRRRMTRVVHGRSRVLGCSS